MLEINSMPWLDPGAAFERSYMPEETKADHLSSVDKGLVAVFLRMSPEERLLSNDNALRAIVELRDAFRRQAANEGKPK